MHAPAELLLNVELCDRDFYNEANGILWRALLQLKADGEAIDSVRLRTYLADRNLLRRVGEDYLLELCDSTIPLPIGQLPVRRLQRLSAQRRIRSAARSLYGSLENVDATARYLRELDDARAALRRVDEPEAGRVPALADCVEQMSFDGKRLTTGLRTLDEATRGGLLLGRFVVLVGAPGAAKTTFAVWWGDQWHREGCTVLYLAADEAREGIVIRLGQLDGFPREGLESPHPSVRAAFAARLRTRPELLVVDPEEDGVTLEESEELVNDAARGRPRILIIDSLQTVPCAASRDAATAKDRMDGVIGVCKSIAKRGALVVAISEMSRAGYRTGDRKTDASGLASGKESGSIEYGGALVMTLRGAKNAVGRLDIEVNKNRLGNIKPELRARLNFERASFDEVAIPTEPERDTAGERLESAKDRVRTVLITHHDLTTVRDVLAHCEGKQGQNHDAVRDMLRTGEIVRVGNGFRIQKGAT